MLKSLSYKVFLNKKPSKQIGFCLDTATSSQVPNCDGVMLEICLDHKFQWAQEGLNCESLEYEVVT